MIAGWLIRIANTTSLDELAIVRDDMVSAADTFSPEDKKKLRAAMASRVNVFDANAAPVPSQKPENVTCPRCSGPMRARMSRHGAFWGCAAYPECKGTRDGDGRSKEERQQERAS